MVMLVVAFVSFSLFNFVGDPINNMVGEETSDEERTGAGETLGLTDPIYIQFTRFVGNASKGNFGISYQLKRPVSELISERLASNNRACVGFSINCIDIWNLIRGLYRY